MNAPQPTPQPPFQPTFAATAQPPAAPAYPTGFAPTTYAASYAKPPRKMNGALVGRVAFFVLLAAIGGLRLYVATHRPKPKVRYIQVPHTTPYVPTIPTFPPITSSIGLGALTVGDCTDALIGIVHEVPCSSPKAVGKVVPPNINSPGCGVGLQPVCTRPLDFHGMP
jgi:hypothetical protein